MLVVCCCHSLVQEFVVFITNKQYLGARALPQDAAELKLPVFYEVNELDVFAGGHPPQILFSFDLNGCDKFGQRGFLGPQQVVEREIPAVGILRKPYMAAGIRQDAEAVHCRWRVQMRKAVAGVTLLKSQLFPYYPAELC